MSDGPTSVFFAGILGEINWINIFGLIIVIIMLAPNILYGIKFSNVKNKCENKYMNILEQIGRYSSMLLMCINVTDYGFASVELYLIYLLGNATLLIIYYVAWVIFFIKQGKAVKLCLAIVPSIIFLLSGVTLNSILLCIAGVMFAIGHIFVTVKNL